MLGHFRVARQEEDGYANWDAMEEVLKRYAKSLRVDISVSLPHCSRREILNEEGTLFIMLYACPFEDNASKTIIPSAYGFNLGGYQERALAPVGKLPTVFDCNGAPVAQFAEGCIYVLFDLPHGRHSDEIIDYIMKDYTLFLSSREKFDEEMEERLEKSAFFNFARLFNETISEISDKVNSEIADAEECLRDLQKDIIKKNRERDSLLKKRIVSRRILEQNNDELIPKKFKELERYAVGGKIKVNQKYVSIPIGQIDIEYEDEIYDIGEFEIQIFPNGDNGGVRCINLTRLIDNENHHPHVDGDGDVCLGNMSESIPEWIGNMDYDVAIFMMIQFLQTCNPDGWYEEVTCWPKKGESEEEWKNRLKQED